MEEDKESERTKAYAQTLWDTALLESGFEIEAPKEFNSRIYSLLAKAYSIPGELGLSEDEIKAAAAEEVCPALHDPSSKCSQMFVSSLTHKQAACLATPDAAHRHCL